MSNRTCPTGGTGSKILADNQSLKIFQSLRQKNGNGPMEGCSSVSNLPISAILDRIKWQVWTPTPAFFGTRRRFHLCLHRQFPWDEHSVDPENRKHNKKRTQIKRELRVNSFWSSARICTFLLERTQKYLPSPGKIFHRVNIFWCILIIFWEHADSKVIQFGKQKNHSKKMVVFPHF